MSNIQFIEKSGKREYAIIPYSLYERLVALLEEAEDIRDLEEFRKNDDGFRIPIDLLQRELAGESPVKLWREYRGWTMDHLAKAVGIDDEELAQIESGTLPAWTEVMARLAKVLEVPVNVLLE